MAWQLVVGLNAVIAVCYFAISTLVLHGLLRTRQLTANPLALATAAIFATCGLHHGHHALHLVTSLDGTVPVLGVREAFGAWHSIAIDALGAVVALTYLALRRSYRTLLNTPRMFEDAVRLAAEEQLREMAYRDQLTGIANRAAYQQLADELRSTEDDVTVLFVDLDGFKAVNDLHGHDAGDRLLRELAQRLDRDLAQARVFRLGGDEFVVVAQQPRCGGLELAAAAQNAIMQPVALRGTDVVLGASIGVATGRGSDGVEQLLRDADADMYRLKARRAAGLALPDPRPSISTP